MSQLQGILPPEERAAGEPARECSVRILDVTPVGDVTQVVEDRPETVEVAALETAPMAGVKILAVLPGVAQSGEKRPWPQGFWGWTRWCWNALGVTWDWLVGVLSLIVGLAVLGTIPLLNFACLGYLLEVTGRVGRTGKLRAGFIGVWAAGRIGSIALGSFVCLLPLRFSWSLVVEGRLIAGEESPGGVVRNWLLLHIALTIVLVAHVLIAIGRGGRLRHFFWPFPTPVQMGRWAWRLTAQIFTRDRKGIGEDLRFWMQPAWTFCRQPGTTLAAAYARGRDDVCDFLESLRLHYYFWLGFRGFVGTMAWLLLPTLLLMSGHENPLLGFLGLALILPVVLYLPWLQAHFASENRLGAFLALGTARQVFRRAPLAGWLAITILLASALPLYLLKIEYPPRETTWLLGVVFIVFMFPAHLLIGWAYGHGLRRPRPAHWTLRWLARLGLLPVASFYLFILYFSQYAAQFGKYNLLDQHAFLMPFLNF